MQGSPTFLEPGTGFMEDNFSTGLGGNGSGGNASDGERDDASLSRLPAAHLLQCGLVPNRPWTGPWELGTPDIKNIHSLLFLVFYCFIMEGHCVLSNAFSASNEMLIWVFLCPINVVYYTDFLTLNHPCISAINPFGHGI